MNWDEYFSKLCLLVASKSKDRSTKVGCIIVGPDHEIRSTGYNGFVRGANDKREDWHERPKKYLVTIHAEGNAVCQAAKRGTSLEGCIAYISLPPCANCAALLVQAGIVEIRVLLDRTDETFKERWKEHLDTATEILSEAGVSLYFIDIS